MGLGPAFDAQFCAAGGGGGSCWMAAQDDSNRVVILENGLVVYTSPPDAAGVTAVAMAASHCSQGMSPQYARSVDFTASYRVTHVVDENLPLT